MLIIEWTRIVVINMNDDMKLVDVSEDNKINKSDLFMRGIYISLIVLLVLGLVIYFFGYEVLKPIIKV